MKRQTRDILIAFCLSILIHLGFLVLSGHIQFAGFGEMDTNAKDSFKVQILDKDKTRLLRQPRTDIEAERKRFIREKIKEDQHAIPELSDLPPLSVQENVEQNLATTFNKQVREKLQSRREDIDLPDLLDQSIGDPVELEVLDIARNVGRDSPGVNRRQIDQSGSPGGLSTDYTSDMMSSLGGLREEIPQFAAAPGTRIPGVPGQIWKPDLLPPKPIIDIEDREVPSPPEIPPLYIQPDQSSRYFSLNQFLSVELFVYHVPGDPKGYFLVRIRPNERSKELPVMSKDIVFVLDASASMGRRTLSQLKTGLKLCLVELREDDLFNVVGFKRNIIQYQPGLVPANPLNIQEAIDFVDELEPSGRTDIYNSLKPISRLARGADHPFIILLFSDGRPNVGVVDSRSIINDLSANLKVNSSIFAFGAGGGMNKYLLDLLSYRNKGFVKFSQDFGRIVDQIESMDNAISDPLLINLSGDYSNISLYDVFPKTLPDLYRGGEILIYGRYTDQEKFSFRIIGEARSERKEFVIELDFPEEDNGPATLPQLWAFRKIYDIIGQMSLQGETPDLLQEIRRISETYDVKTPYYQ